MFKLDPKERWSYKDISELKLISDHFSPYKKLSHKDQIAEKIKYLFDEGNSLYGAIEIRKTRKIKEKEKEEKKNKKKTQTQMKTKTQTQMKNTGDNKRILSEITLSKNQKKS